MWWKILYYSYSLEGNKEKGEILINKTNLDFNSKLFIWFQSIAGDSKNSINIAFIAYNFSTEKFEPYYIKIIENKNISLILLN